jgi:hypothetical protein
MQWQQLRKLLIRTCWVRRCTAAADAAAADRLLLLVSLSAVLVHTLSSSTRKLHGGPPLSIANVWCAPNAKAYCVLLLLLRSAEQLTQKHF